MTICTQHRECIFGNIQGDEMVLNDPGEMVRKWWRELENKFKVIELDEYRIMPNHFHGIICIVGADLRVCPCTIGNTQEGAHTGAPLHRVIQWFKTMTTNEYIKNVYEKNWERFNGTLWQRNYYEHILRNESDMNCIRQYIVDNPSQWENDKNNPENI